MSDTETATRRDVAADLKDGLRRAGRGVWLASLGAVAIVGDEARSAFETLVERGRQVHAGSDTTPVGRAATTMARQARDLGRRVEGGLQHGSQAVLRRCGMPTAADIAALNRQVEQLGDSIERLRGRGTPSPDGQ